MESAIKFNAGVKLQKDNFKDRQYRFRLLGSMSFTGSYYIW